MWFKKSLIISTMLMTFQVVYSATPKGMVNILTWYKYLKSPEIASIVNDKCGVKIYYDEYYTTAECLQRVSMIGVGNVYHYDIAIVPGDIYEYSKGRIGAISSNLNKLIKGYDSNIKNHYLLRNYPNNVVYFMLSVSGFIWDPAVAELAASDDISSMFEKAKNNIVMVVDDPIAIWDLINNNRKLSGVALSQAFDKFTKSTDIYITSGYSELYNKSNFAFAFQRSETAVSAIEASRNKRLRFLVHPKYSYIIPDLMAELNTRPETQCVAKILASKEVLDIVQKNTNYLSPYGTYKSINNPIFLDVYKTAFDNIHKMRWLDSVPVNIINMLEDMWLKIWLLPQVMKNHSLFKS